jgi:YggT family protein
MDPVAILVLTLSRFLGIYLALLIIRVLLTWFPSIDWSSQPFALLSQLTDPYLNIFRGLIPPLGGFDLSPMVALLLLQFAQQALGQVVMRTASSFGSMFAG